MNIPEILTPDTEQNNKKAEYSSNNIHKSW
jgi:hypothetical protein